MSDVRYWLWLSRLKGVTAFAAKRYLHAFPSVKALYLAGEMELRQVEAARESEIRALLNKNIAEAESIEEACRARGIRILCLPDAAYPDRLRSIDDPPLVLYVRGQLPPVDERLCVGVVGTRKSTDYGRETAGRIAGELCRQGGVIVTGLAEGIDSAAAQGALRTRGQVIAVLGTGLDRVYPARNARLQETVGQVGTLISEYPPDSSASKFSFPQRNRIISGLSLGVVVVQAPQRSGALITAARAQEQGRDVFVVPGAVDDPGFLGSNSLIRDGATLIRSGRDVLEEYRFRCPELLRNGTHSAAEGENGSQKPTKEAIDKNNTVAYDTLSEQLDSLSEQELKLVGALAQGELFADELIRRSGLEAGDGMAALTMLQLRGYVREQNGRQKLVVRYREQ